jgi:hypothetical protein
MTHLDLLLPFSIPPTSLSKDLQRELKTPALATLIGKATIQSTEHFEDYARQLPHERFSPRSAISAMKAHGVQATEGYWFIVSPVHLHIARDHLVLTDQRRLNLSHDESRTLFADAAALCEESGKTLIYGDAKTWLLRADDWSELETATLDAACGHNVDIWMARGEQALAWRKLQNEIQMQWFVRPLHDQRAERGEKPINSVWLWGGADLTKLSDIASSDFMDGQAASFADVSAKDGEVKIALNHLLEPALNNDWGAWLTCMDELEKNWFAPALAALQAKQIKSIRLRATDANRVITFELTPWNLRQFWKKASLQKVLFAN